MTQQPSRLQLALALTVVRSKPPHLHIRDYVRHLRSQIQQGIRPQLAASLEKSQDKYIDSSLHYKTLLRESQKREEDLKNQLAAAEKEAERLRAQLIAQETTVPAQKKRKSAASDKSTAKRIKFEHRQEAPDDDMVDDINTALDAVGAVSREGDTLLRHAYYLRKASEVSDPDQEHLLKTLEQTLIHAKHVILSLPVFDHVRKASGPNASTMLKAYRNGVVPLIVAALRRLAAIDSALPDGAVVYRVMSLCQALVEYIGKVASIISQTQEVNTTADPKSESTDSTSPGNSLSKSAVNILCALIKSLGPKKLSNSDSAAGGAGSEALSSTAAAIAEGLLHLVLTRLGQLLNILTFSSALGDNDTASPAHGTTDSDALKLASARLEASALTPLLRLLLPGRVHANFLLEDTLDGDGIPNTPLRPTTRSMTKVCSQAHASTPRNNSTSQIQHDEAENHAKTPVTSAQTNSLVAAPLSKVQNTLLQGIFGTDSHDGEGFSDDCLRSGLEDAEYHEFDLEDEASTNEVTRPDGVEQFVMEMWYRVGWDVLAKGFESAT